MTTHRIAVIGAGPGGLTCARVLQRQGVDVTVYDLDTDLDSRNQGGSLDLHADSGQIALREAELLTEFLARSRPEGQARRNYSAQGELLEDERPGPGEAYAPEIDRGDLRRLLAESLAPGTIRWDHALAAAEPNGDGTHRLTFRNDTTAEVDLLIGADGAWSKVRPLVSPATPYYTGVTFVEAHFADVDREHPEVADVVGDGLIFALGEGKGLFGQRNGEGAVRVYITMREELDWPERAGIDLADTAAVRAELLARFGDFGANLRPLVGHNDGPYIHRPIFVLPAPHRWPSTPGVTLLGDAAHLMTALGGNGANFAMLDGAELALAVAEQDTLELAIADYERKMAPRAEWAATSIDGLAEMFGTNVPVHPG